MLPFLIFSPLQQPLEVHQAGRERWEIPLYRVPNQIEIYLIVLMDYLVPHAGHVAPWDCGVKGSNFQR